MGRARSIAVAAPLSTLLACSLVAGLGPVPGALPPSPDASTTADGSGEDAPPSTDAPPPSDAPATDSPPGNAPTIGPCRIFPPDNPWNRDVSNDPVDTAAMASIDPNMALTTALHPDWGDNTNMYGNPYDVAQAAPVPIALVGNAAQSDTAPCGDGGSLFCYPIPPNAQIEAGGGHVLVLDTTGAPDACTLYEMVGASKDDADTGWTADHGAIFHLGSNDLRMDGWVSTDAAGLPVLPGLVRYDETMAGAINHAIRFTMRNVFLGYIHPATHSDGVSTPGLPPMGLRMRLKSSFDVTGFAGPTLVILKAMKQYGIILADRGSDWYITGDRNDGWTSVMDGIHSALMNVHGSDFEIVVSGQTMTTGL